MDLTDEITIAATKPRVYAALNDPEVLQRCIPGCEHLEKLSETELEATVLLKVGPVKTRFKGRVTLDVSAAPDAFTLTGQGSGGAAGHAKGGAEVVLTETAPQETLLRYEARAEVGGKLAQLGNRLIQGTAKKLSARFFEEFARVVEEDAVA
ncbi:carbon monoxide dehydrogenase subunit G [Roseivivax sp. GX 12232]|uniref:CoxG family protein n=1 Tax=Roseivivax sp. GX 12232 TaxID=2900547 RepID=UPI001E3D4E3A|nr:carbon monoxide dehydrogenase subunit G [Roseivivax sp. GX 12232]MCE0506608.1 carbon monoxide dehydrogenase subunit G [Roseivivax sp. GX 12232]